MRALQRQLRHRPRSLAGPFWYRDGWVAFAADGTRVELPRTVANEKAFGCAGRDKTGPQLQLTSLYHLGTGLPWAWPRKKNDRLPRVPKVREATEKEKHSTKRTYERITPLQVHGVGWHRQSPRP